jgi:dephospho-CoA kinase
LLNVALTGNIAAGKSTVVELWRRWGATVIDADALAREAQAPGSQVTAAIANRFGADVLTADGSLDRAALRAKVMGDDEALAALNAIVHPAVRQRRADLHRAAAERGDLLLVNDIPLLFEAADPSRFDVVVLVDAPIAVRRARLRTLRQLSNEDADRMIAAQMPAERKRARSAIVIENGGTRDELETHARTAFEQLRARAARATWGELAGPVALLADAPRDADAAALEAFAAGLAAAAVPVVRAAGKAPTLAKALASHMPPTIVATPAALANARTAIARTGETGALRALISQDDGPLDLRAFGGPRAVLLDNPLP